MKTQQFLQVLLMFLQSLRKPTQLLLPVRLTIPSLNVQLSLMISNLLTASRLTGTTSTSLTSIREVHSMTSLSSQTSTSLKTLSLILQTGSKEILILQLTTTNKLSTASLIPQMLHHSPLEWLFTMLVTSINLSIPQLKLTAPIPQVIWEVTKNTYQALPVEPQIFMQFGIQLLTTTAVTHQW